MSEEARGVVSHGIGLPGDVVMPGDIAVKSLVDAKEAEEMGWRFGGGGTALALPKEGGQVVSVAENSALTDVKVLGQDIQMDEPSRQFKV